MSLPHPRAYGAARVAERPRPTALGPDRVIHVERAGTPLGHGRCDQHSRLPQANAGCFTWDACEPDRAGRGRGEPTFVIDSTRRDPIDGGPRVRHLEPTAGGRLQPPGGPTARTITRSEASARAPILGVPTPEQGGPAWTRPPSPTRAPESGDRPQHLPGSADRQTLDRCRPRQGLAVQGIGLRPPTRIHIAAQGAEAAPLAIAQPRSARRPRTSETGRAAPNRVGPAPPAIPRPTHRGRDGGSLSPPRRPAASLDARMSKVPRAGETNTGPTPGLVVLAGDRWYRIARGAVGAVPATAPAESAERQANDRSRARARRSGASACRAATRMPLATAGQGTRPLVPTAVHGRQIAAKGP